MARAMSLDSNSVRQVAVAVVLLLVGGGGATVAHRSLLDSTPTVADVRRMMATESPYLADRQVLLASVEDQGALWLEIQELRQDVAAMKTDIQWIRAALSR